MFLQEPPSTLAEIRMGVEFISIKRTPSEGLGQVLVVYLVVIHYRPYSALWSAELGASL